MRPRVIPVLLVEDGGLVKTINFKRRIYLGDPINTVRLFNDMQVDELIVLDISASKDNKGPNYSLIEDIRNEAFMPLVYGGGIKSVEDSIELIRIGVEKIAINSFLQNNISVLTEISKRVGSQSIIASIDISKNILGKHFIYSHAKNKNLSLNIQEYLKKIQEAGIGEIFLNFTYKDGVWGGYDFDFIKDLSPSIDVPLVVCGGASNLVDLKKIIDMGADAAAAGSLFSFAKKNSGVLINYPSQRELDSLF
tara:strand:+ start:15745 stop:16497 length:753 start_codon:yes stop_codon:yes gene_type:complete